jgi:hypothetical protein
LVSIFESLDKRWHGGWADPRERICIPILEERLIGSIFRSASTADRRRICILIFEGLGEGWHGIGSG